MSARQININIAATAATAADREPCGVVVVDKPPAMTSFDVVARLRRVYGLRRVGHAGTLDPDATGVLVVLIGRAAKASEYISSSKKSYSAVLRLGLTTDTEDVSGRVLTQLPPDAALPTVDDVIIAARGLIGDDCNNGDDCGNDGNCNNDGNRNSDGNCANDGGRTCCKGAYMQTPPMYSALKRGGQKLVDLARRGIEIEREPRPVSIYSLRVAPTDSPCDYSLDVECSGGTYIRTLCADIGARLGCGGCMASLRRTECAGFRIEDAHTLDEIAADPTAHLLDVESLFMSLPAVTVSGAAEKSVRNGAAVAINDSAVAVNDAANNPNANDAAASAAAISDRVPGDGARVRLLGRDGFFALGQVDGGAVRAIKFFYI